MMRVWHQDLEESLSSKKKVNPDATTFEEPSSKSKREKLLLFFIEAGESRINKWATLQTSREMDVWVSVCVCVCVCVRERETEMGKRETKKAAEETGR